MTEPPPSFWSEYLRRTLQRYDEALVREVAGKLIKPRSRWPIEELIDRCVAVASNAAVVDRRVQSLDPAGRQALACIAHSRWCRWRLGSLVEILATLGHADGLKSLLELLDTGLLYPDLLHSAQPPTRLKSFEQWLGHATPTSFAVFAHPQVAARALGEDLGLSEWPGVVPASGAIHEADGLEWPLRLAVLWQQVAAAPMRRTQQGEFFKRDLERLRTDPVLNSAPADALIDMPDISLFTAAMALAEGVLQEKEGELRAGALPEAWNEGVPAALASLWTALPSVDAWNPLAGYVGPPEGGNPFVSAYLLVLLLMAQLPDEAWAEPSEIGQWLLERHPYWSAESIRPSRLQNWVPAFLLGIAYQLRIVQTRQGPADTLLVRLSPTGRWLLGYSTLPDKLPTYSKTLTVQPNLEIMAYRQGLTPGLVATLGRFATWKNLGAACVLQLQPESVYRALEAGESFESILQTLERHGIRPTPTPVIESLRTWSNKRERIGVYASATLLEFSSERELNDALARGLPGVRLSEHLVVVPDESAIDFRHFRLTATRDYALPPEKCVEIEPDGVTLAIDLARSDLLLETELPRFAELVERPSANGRRFYRLTPASLAAGRQSGLTLQNLELWFQQRAGQPLSPAARLLLTGADAPPPQFQRHLVMHVPTPELAEGLQQWPGTRSLILAKLGPTTLSVAEEHLEALRERLASLGIPMNM